MDSSPPVSETDRNALQHRTLRVMMLSQVFAGAGLAAGISVGALLAEDMIGSTRFAGLPVAMFTLGSAGTAFLVGVLSDRRGRRVGLATGYLAGAVGGSGVTLAAILDNVPLMLVSLLVYGAGTATNLQARYAGGDLAPLERRGSAMSVVLVATTLGAVAGPNLVDPVGDLAAALDWPRLAGPFALAAVAYGLASIVLTIWLRPDPLLTAREIGHRESVSGSRTRDTSPIVADMKAVGLGGLAMVVAQLVMVAVMTMTPVHMRDHGHGPAATGVVIGLHIAAMFLPSPLTGRLVDRFGSTIIVGAAGLTLLLSGVVAALIPNSMAGLTIALILLGLGWNLGLLGGTTLVAKSVPLKGRASVQGRVDVAVAIAGATGGLSSGVMVAATSFPVLALSSAVFAAVALGLALRPLRSAAQRVAAIRV